MHARCCGLSRDPLALGTGAAGVTIRRGRPRSRRDAASATIGRMTTVLVGFAAGLLIATVTTPVGVSGGTRTITPPPVTLSADLVLAGQQG
jgi:hypothetical protein